MADVPELGDDTDVGLVQALPILSSELVDDDLDSSLRFSLDPRPFDSSLSTCLKEIKTQGAEKSHLAVILAIFTVKIDLVDTSVTEQGIMRFCKVSGEILSSSRKLHSNDMVK